MSGPTDSWTVSFRDSPAATRHTAMCCADTNPKWYDVRCLDSADSFECFTFQEMHKIALFFVLNTFAKMHESFFDKECASAHL